MAAKLRKGRQPTGIQYRILAYMSVRNLVYKKLRTILTVSGVVIGIGAIVFLVSLALGLRNTVNKQVIGSQSVKTIDITSPDPTAVHLSNENLSKFAKFSGVTQVSKTYVVAGRVSFANSITDAVTYGVDQEYLQLLSPKLVNGRSTLSSGNEQDAVVNLSLLKIVGIKNGGTAIGKKLKVTANITQSGQPIKTQPKGTFTIKGVIDSGLGSELYIYNSFLQKAGLNDYSQAKVVVSSENSVKAVRRQVESLGFVTQSPVDTIDQINHLFRIFAFILGGFGGVGMIIAILGMFNTLTISLLERTSELGLMMAIGARRRDVKRLFTIEALILSLAGGIGGIVCAWTLGTVINIFISTIARRRGLSGSIELFSVPLFIAGLAIFFILAVGYIVVLLPSRRAARINPIDALRHE